jgi:hypothetical protein
MCMPPLATAALPSGQRQGLASSGGVVVEVISDGVMGCSDGVAGHLATQGNHIVSGVFALLWLFTLV